MIFDIELIDDSTRESQSFWGRKRRNFFDQKFKAQWNEIGFWKNRIEERLKVKAGKRERERRREFHKQMSTEESVIVAQLAGPVELLSSEVSRVVQSGTLVL